MGCWLYHLRMIRTQISLTEEQATRLRRLAAKRRTSMSALIREAVDTVHPEEIAVGRREMWNRALAVMGTLRSDGADVSVEHDRYLDEIYGE
jgi:hypothetical protein